MKLRVLFLKKIHILLFICIFIFAWLSILIYQRRPVSQSAIESFYTINTEKLVKCDFTGDGKKDILYINLDKNKYLLQILANKKIYNLNPSSVVKTFGNYYNYCPMSVYSADVNNNNTKDLIVQSTDKGIALQHILIWNGKKFKDIFSAYNNLVGIIHNEDKKPQLISGNFNLDKISLSWNKYNEEKFTPYKNNGISCSDEICQFIKYIENIQSKNNNIYNLLSPEIDGSYLHILDKLYNSKTTYKFTYGNFYDVVSSKNNSLLQYIWILNFQTASKDDINVPNGYITLTLKLKEFQNNFKIFSIENKKGPNYGPKGDGGFSLE